MSHPVGALGVAAFFGVDELHGHEASLREDGAAEVGKSETDVLEVCAA